MAAMSADLRQRRRSEAEKNEDMSFVRTETKKEEPEVDMRPKKSAGVGWGGAFFFLMVARYYSASYNNIHDCDEVFNYWEPLHYLLYKSGFQTWEYSSEFALRSYLYLLLHAVMSGPSFLLFRAGLSKVQVFYTLRLALGLLSAFTEATLVTAANQKYGSRVGVYTLALLCLSSGCFNASTSGHLLLVVIEAIGRAKVAVDQVTPFLCFLPSTFSMYAITLAAALVLMGDKHKATVVVAAFGVLVGWPFAAMAAAPLVVYSLTNGGFLNVFLTGLLTTVCTMVPSVLADRYFYGRWTSSVVNLVLYNVFSGEGSTLYGVEGALFYLQNAFNNFNFAFVLALLSPSLLLISKHDYSRLLVAVSPIFIWISFMSLQPHKEERFLYPVYPLICLAAAATLERLHDYLPKSWEDNDFLGFLVKGVKKTRPLILGVILALSYCRTLSLFHGYSAPMQAYRHLPALNASSPLSSNSSGMTVCVGSEWYRFPSSFFLPSSNYQVAWLDDGFRGLLPHPFDPSMGGTKSAPQHFNSKNKASSSQFVSDEGLCDFLVELELDRDNRLYQGSNKACWETVYAQRFLDKEQSPAKYRAFFLPWIWEESNTFGTYRLLKRINEHGNT